MTCAVRVSPPWQTKSGVHACDAIWTGSIPTRSGIRVLKASVTRDQHSGSPWVWFHGWAPVHVVQSARDWGPKSRIRFSGISIGTLGSLSEAESASHSERCNSFTWSAVYKLSWLAVQVLLPLWSAARGLFRLYANGNM